MGSKILRNVKNRLGSWNKNTLQGQILIAFAHSSCLLLDDSADRIARELYWTNQEFSSDDIIVSPWFSMLVCHLGDEQ